jgi:hypothetical protein
MTLICEYAHLEVTSVFTTPDSLFDSVQCFEWSVMFSVFQVIQQVQCSVFDDHGLE